MGQYSLIGKINVIEKYIEENLTYFRMYREIDPVFVTQVMKKVCKEERGSYKAIAIQKL